MSLSIAADADALAVVRHVLDGLAQLDAITARTLDDLQIAVGEACANVVTHAYRDRATGPLDVDVRLGDVAVQVVVRDQGSGLQASTGRSGGGMGLAIMDALSDELVIATPGSTGHEVRMTFGLGAT